MIEIIFLVYVFVVGACIGSFLNVVALRGLTNESIVFPASKCPVCKEPIKWYDNIPIFSYFFTFRGKCRNCGCHVSWQYPIVETITALLFLLTYKFFGISWQTLILWVLTSISVVISITDFKEKSILDVHLWILIATATLFSVLFNDWKLAVYGLIIAAIGMEVLSKLLYFLKSKDVEDGEFIDEAEEKSVIKDIHFWLVLAVASIFCFIGGNNIVNTLGTFFASLLLIKLFGFGINYLTEKVVKKKERAAVTESLNEEEAEIKDYVNKEKRAFGSGDTYVMAAIGALGGWQFALVVFVAAVILQVMFIVPQFIMGIVNNAKTRLLTSIIAFVIFLAMQLLIIFKFMQAPDLVIYSVLAGMLYFAFDIIIRIKVTTLNMEIKSMPFAPALLISMFIVFYGIVSLTSFMK